MDASLTLTVFSAWRPQSRPSKSCVLQLPGAIMQVPQPNLQILFRGPELLCTVCDSPSLIPWRETMQVPPVPAHL